jgi:tRNA threonylcarbamoyladenosine biosynthesis protein TsaB
MSNNYLAIETCSESCSVALSVAGNVSERAIIDPQGHAHNLLPMINELLQEMAISIEQLDAIGFSQGPGAFTGVRIGTAVAQGLSVAHDIPLVPVSSLQVLAQSAYRIDKAQVVLSALDARMSEVYFGAFSLVNGLMQPVDQQQVIRPENIDFSVFSKRYKDQALHAVGIGWDNYPQLLDAVAKQQLNVKVISNKYPQAIDIIEYAKNGIAESKSQVATEVEPIYLRDKVVN